MNKVWSLVGNFCSPMMYRYLYPSSLFFFLSQVLICYLLDHPTSTNWEGNKRKLKPPYLWENCFWYTCSSGTLICSAFSFIEHTKRGEHILVNKKQVRRRRLILKIQAKGMITSPLHSSSFLFLSFQLALLVFSGLSSFSPCLFS